MGLNLPTREDAKTLSPTDLQLKTQLLNQLVLYQTQEWRSQLA